MSSSTNISTLYHEFTDALTEVLAENAVGPARRGHSQGLALPLRRTSITASMDIFLRSKPHSNSGKPCKISVTQTCLYQKPKPARSGDEVHRGSRVNL
jgi:hypothetical protein